MTHLGRPLLEWLVDDALPMWSSRGVDRDRGGFFEMIDTAGTPVEAPRRARVVARQVYVFATAARRGWMADADALVEHGLRFLLDRMKSPDGTFVSSVTPDGRVVDGRFDLYEQSFVLFALASACEGRPDRDARLRGEAEALLDVLGARWRHPVTGFEESVPRTLPLRSNPHMHLLEAALAWMTISDGPSKSRWTALAGELVALCLGRFIDSRTGALREYFAGDWQPMPDASGRVVEPGHQFEWAWLLMRWSADGTRPQAAAAAAAAARLIAIGEAHGVDRERGVAVDALDDALKVVESTAKLWPQTERIKAWHAAHRVADQGGFDPTDRLRAAIDGANAYLLATPAGLWQEQMRADRGFVEQACRASSLYHVVCAIETITRCEPT